MKNALWILLLVPTLAACDEAKPAPITPPPPKPKPGEPPPKAKPPGEPDHIKVQHILVGSKESMPKKATRSTDEARELAQRILELARSGVPMDELIAKYGTDDSPPGIYGMANHSVTPNAGEQPRSGMVAAFGDVGFKLAVGEVGMSDYDKTTSPYGWHVIKRLQ